MSRIGIIGDNSIEYIDKLLEIWKKGDSAVLIDWRIPVDKILQMLYEAGASKCYIDDRLFDSFKNINDLEFDFYHSCNEGKLMKIPQYLYDKFADLIITCDEALILYSSGTTGKSKGVILSMNAIYQNCISIVEYMNLNHSDVLCITKPLSHSSSLTGELLVILKSKVEGYICSSLTLPSRVLKYVKKYNISRLFLNPQLLRVYSNEINKKDYDINCLKKIYTSGSILNETVYQKSKIAFRDVEIINGYGLSEAGPRVTTQELSNVRDHSAGKPIKNVELIIVNDDGNMCKNGNRGYIHIKSHSMFMGYVVGCAKHKNLVDGWFNTGDIGYLDSNNNLHVLGRKDDLIIKNSYKIYAYDIENSVSKEFDLDNVFTFLYEVEDSDYMCLAYYGEDNLINSIKKYCINNFAPYECPDFIINIDFIPVNNNGKIQKSIIKENVRKKIWNIQ